MHKCPNCGQEYEGNFCPACGERWQEQKTCPKCGAKLDGSARFCNECGYSFVKTTQTQQNKSGFKDKLNSAVSWIKSHLKIVIPIVLAVVLVIILSCSIPACIANRTNGTYYKLNFNGEPDKSTYFILKSGKWEDEDGESGTYKKDGDNIRFYVEIFGESEEMCDGTLSNYVLKVNDDTYISEKHKHAYGEWETTREATSNTDGIKTRTCACGEEETEKIPAMGTVGLNYELNSNKTAYSVKRIGTATDSEICIPAVYNNLPVTSIGSKAFYECRGLKSITISDSVTSIGEEAFVWCSSLTSITIPDSVTSIGSKAFFNCSGLESVTIGGGVTYIGNSAFKDCRALTSITIPDGVTLIASAAFSTCTKLTSITIPDSVTSIGNGAFFNCISLTSINFKGTIAQWIEISKGSDWNSYTGNFVVNCIDGD